MRVIGIDPGLRRTGWGLIEVSGSRLTHLANGVCEVLTGAAMGLKRAIRSDVLEDADRVVTLWDTFAMPPDAGDRLRLTAGCDKHADTCRNKFANFLNFQGFPDMPGEDWVLSVPRSGASNTGGSLVR